MFFLQVVLSTVFVFCLHVVPFRLFVRAFVRSLLLPVCPSGRSLVRCCHLIVRPYPFVRSFAAAPRLSVCRTIRSFAAVTCSSARIPSFVRSLLASVCPSVHPFVRCFAAACSSVHIRSSVRSAAPSPAPWRSGSHEIHPTTLRWCRQEG